MNRTTMSRSLALTRARYARAAFAVAAVGSAAVAMLVLPRFTIRPALDDVQPAPAATTVSVSVASGLAPGKPVNSAGISDRFMRFSNRPKVEPPPEVPVEMGDDEPPAPAPSESARFLGVIREPGRLLAMIAMGGRQRIVAEGEEVSGLTVVSIGEESMTVREGGVEKKIHRDQRSGGTSTSLVKGRSPVNTGQPSAEFDPSAAEGRAAVAQQQLQQMQQRGRGRPNLQAIPVMGGGRSREQRSAPGQ